MRSINKHVICSVCAIDETVSAKSIKLDLFLAFVWRLGPRAGLLKSVAASSVIRAMRLAPGSGLP